MNDRVLIVYSTKDKARLGHVSSYTITSNNNIPYDDGILHENMVLVTGTHGSNLITNITSTNVLEDAQLVLCELNDSAVVREYDIVGKSLISSEEHEKTLEEVLEEKNYSTKILQIEKDDIQE